MSSCEQRNPDNHGVAGNQWVVGDSVNGQVKDTHQTGKSRTQSSKNPVLLAVMDASDYPDRIDSFIAAVELYGVRSFFNGENLRFLLTLGLKDVLGAVEFAMPLVVFEFTKPKPRPSVTVEGSKEYTIQPPWRAI